MNRFPRRGAAAAVLLTALACVAPAVARDAPAPAPSADVRRQADSARRGDDHDGRAFIVIDKRAARLWVYGADGRVEAHTPVLLGRALGDVVVPGVADRPIAAIAVHERITPAGRFVAEGGVNARGEDVLWLSYDDAIALHRLRATDPRERRSQRLASASAADNRISYGCINVPRAFFDTVLVPRFVADERGVVVYVLPDAPAPR